MSPTNAWAVAERGLSINFQKSEDQLSKVKPLVALDQWYTTTRLSGAPFEAERAWL